MHEREEKSESFYADVAEVVGFARWMLQGHEPVSEMDRRILSDLRNVHIGLLKEAALARGTKQNVLSTSAEPFGIDLRVDAASSDWR